MIVILPWKGFNLGILVYGVHYVLNLCICLDKLSMVNHFRCYIIVKLIKYLASRIGYSLAPGLRSKSFKISAFKGGSRHDDSVGRSNGSKSLKNPVKVSYLQHESEESSAESSKVQNVVPAPYTEADETATSSLVIQKLFKSWLMLLRTPSQTPPVEGAVEQPSSVETSETSNIVQKQEKGELLKAARCYFLGLDATIKIPLLVL